MKELEDTVARFSVLDSMEIVCGFLFWIFENKRNFEFLFVIFSGFSRTKGTLSFIYLLS